MTRSLINSLLRLPVAYRWVITLAFIAVLVALSVTPGAAGPGDNAFAWLYTNTSTSMQKVLHVACYAALSILLMWSLNSVASFKTRASIAALLSLAIGIALESVQTQIPGRFGTLLDVLLNVLGTILGLLIATILL